jgi:ABC-type nitrate/sulfonate/bicarbonate transport system substrate-binding protein
MTAPESESSLQAPISRRSFLGGGLKMAGGLALAGAAGGIADGLLSGFTADASSLTLVTYQLGWVTNTEFAGTYLAQKYGYFAAEGLKVGLLPGGTTAVEPVVVSGKALVGDTNADTVSAAIANGADLRIIGARYQKNPFCIISSAKNPIKSPQGLIGKKVGVNAYNLTGWTVFLALNGIKSTDVDTVNEGYTTGPEELANGNVDAWMGFSTNEPGVLTLAGFDNYYYLMANFKYHVYADVYIATTKSIKDKPAELAAFLSAERKGWAYDVKSPSVGTALTTKLYQKKEGFSAKQQGLENVAQKALIVTPYTSAHGLFAMNPDDITANLTTLKFAADLGTAYYTKRDLFDTSILAMVK